MLCLALFMHHRTWVRLGCLRWKIETVLGCPNSRALSAQTTGLTLSPRPQTSLTERLIMPREQRAFTFQPTLVNIGPKRPELDGRTSQPQPLAFHRVDYTLFSTLAKT